MRPFRTNRGSPTLSQRRYHLIAKALFGISGGLSVSFFVWLFGLPYVLMGLAIAFGRAYPAWMGWWPPSAAAVRYWAAPWRFCGVELVPIPALYGAFIAPLNLWLAAMGMFMWRRSRSVVGRAATATAPTMASG